MFKRIVAVEECDATGDAISNAAWSIKKSKPPVYPNT
jgi:hypothetical protein